ncbi:hypothetical protein E2C01_035928 [Portunus trituberculatus]|uniref:Uncharacterized protein n=1 Tax=Portunus trituberculatus TaxID=210409 RepID=A0A5B7FAM0_PORTR|nr:hypothetical protein [Portunus trituberculatus]
MHKLEITHNNAIRTILRAPRWTSIVTLREECNLPSIANRILARTCHTIALYQRRWPESPLTTAFRQAFQRPPAARPDRDWVHSAPDASRSLDVDDVVRCEPDLPLADYAPQPPWAPLFTITTFQHEKPKCLPTALLRQETLKHIHSCNSSSSRLYYTDGSVGDRGKAGAAFVCDDVTNPARTAIPRMTALCYIMFCAVLQPHLYITYLLTSTKSLQLPVSSLTPPSRHLLRSVEHILPHVNNI